MRFPHVDAGRQQKRLEYRHCRDECDKDQRNRQRLDGQFSAGAVVMST